MNGPEHYREAEFLTRLATDDVETKDAALSVAEYGPRWLAAAEVHSRLADVAARIDAATLTPDALRDKWQEATG